MRKVNVSHILVNHAYEAEDIIKKIKEGEPFESLASSRSLCSSRSDRGSLGLLMEGKAVEEFEDVAFALKPGEISEPVRTRFGYHIIRRDT